MGRHRIDFLKDLVAFVDLDLQSARISANFREKSAIAKKVKLLSRVSALLFFPTLSTLPGARIINIYGSVITTCIGWLDYLSRYFVK